MAYGSAMSTEKRLFQIVLLAALFGGWVYWKNVELKTIPAFSKSKHIAQRNFTAKVPRKECKNVLFNLTIGVWKSLPDANITAFDRTYEHYWRQRGILQVWRKDGKCGYMNHLPKLKWSKWPAVGSICDKNGPKPCCSNFKNGICTAQSNMTCDCQSCSDMRKYVYAELSEWNPKDSRCLWSLFNGSQACDVIHRSSYTDLHFVGDSFMRNMFAAFVMLLSDDPVRGAWGKHMTETQKKLCVAERFYFWGICRKIVDSFDDVLYPQKLCGEKSPNFTATTHVFYSFLHGRHFKQLVQKLIGKQGSLVMVGVGMHMHYNASVVIDKFLDPAIKTRDEFYKNSSVHQSSRWPRFFFMLPPLAGLLKPTEHLQTQNNYLLTKFAKSMQDYCKKRYIPVFDFRQITRFVHSFDGSHYGLGVNLMKNQVLLNYIDQESL